MLGSQSVSLLFSFNHMALIPNKGTLEIPWKKGILEKKIPFCLQWVRFLKLSTWAHHHISELAVYLFLSDFFANI